MSRAGGSLAMTWSASRTPPTKATSPISPPPRWPRCSARSTRHAAASTKASGPKRRPTERARVLRAFIDHVEAARDELVPTLVAEAGQSTFFADFTQLRAGASIGRQTIDLFLSMSHEEANPVPVDELVRGRVALSIRRHEPVGVVTAITPYNAALIMAFQKLIPALMAGNSVILRPSPLTPLSSLVFGAAADAAGLPPGVLSVVVEAGAAGAELLTTHPAVDMVSFTGSTAVGTQILAQAAPTVKRVSLELGGKSAQIYLPDAVHRAAGGAAVSSPSPPARRVSPPPGCWCRRSARTRCSRRSARPTGDQGRPAHRAVGDDGPGDQRRPARPVRALRRAGRRARRQGGLRRRPAGGPRPRLLLRAHRAGPADNANPAAQEEIFGPVLGVIGYRDSTTRCGSPTTASTACPARCTAPTRRPPSAVARRLRTGAVNVNTGVFSAYAPSGGYKQSGLGRERGPDGIREFQEVKHMSIGELK